MYKLIRKGFLPVLLFLMTGPYTDSSFAQFFGGGGRGGMGQGSYSSGSQSVQRYYQSNGMIGEAIIEADHDSRSIIVIADEETNEHIRQIIEQLDQPVQQVLIKVLFLEVTYNDDRDLGVDGLASLNLRPSGNGQEFQTSFGVAAENLGGFYRLIENDVSITVRAIAEVGRTEVLSRPSILTRNNQEAVITVGKEFPKITNTRYLEDGETLNTVEYEDIGIILRVTPFITKDGLVEMILAPEISNLTDETVALTTNVNTPIIAKRSADTVVVTPNGQTVVIGGMMEDNNVEITNKVPLLGDIPLLGMLFRRNIKNKTKTELLIFLTPYVVDGPAGLVEMSQNERAYSELIPNTFSEEQLNKFIDNLPVTKTEESKEKDSSKEIESESNQEESIINQGDSNQESSKSNKAKRSRRRSSIFYPGRVQ